LKNKLISILIVFIILIFSSLTTQALRTPYGGVCGCIDGQCYSDAQAFVYTKLDLGKQPHVMLRLWGEAYIEEKRNTHPKYLVTYRFEYYHVDEEKWRYMPQWPVIVEEDVTFDNDLFEEFAFGFLFKEDRWIPFRLNVSYWLFDKNNICKLDHSAVSLGVWRIEELPITNFINNIFINRNVRFNVI
jgi:hypothetical protein